MENSHGQWADYYDIAYEWTFGGDYEDFTVQTLDAISRIIKPGSRVLDFGAGTGRLSLPLAQKGYRVNAVECSKEMCRVLERKARAESIKMRENGDLFIINKSFCDDLTSSIKKASHDFGICVFTTLNYLLNDSEIRAFGRSCSHGLKEKSKLLVSFVEDMQLMQRFYRKPLYGKGRNPSDWISRTIHIRTLRPSYYEYSETAEGIFNGKRFFYKDPIPLREWTEGEIIKILKQEKLSYCANISQEILGMGEVYLLFERHAS